MLSYFSIYMYGARYISLHLSYIITKLFVLESALFKDKPMFVQPFVLETAHFKDKPC